MKKQYCGTRGKEKRAAAMMQQLLFMVRVTGFEPAASSSQSEWTYVQFSLVYKGEISFEFGICYVNCYVMLRKIKIGHF